jgi:hypothetical protein
MCSSRLRTGATPASPVSGGSQTPRCTVLSMRSRKRVVIWPRLRSHLDVLLRDVRRVGAGTLHPDLRHGMALPEKDWPIVAGALAARPTHLITGDLRRCGPYFGNRLSGILVLPPAAYLRSRRGS